MAQKRGLMSLMSKKAATFFARIRRYARRLSRKDRFVPLARPRLHVETTNFCNANCVFCANAKMSRPVVSLEPDLFEQAVDDYEAMGGTHLDFNVTIGDPLLDKRLFARARYARDRGMSGLGFVTTLQWLHRHETDEFLELFDWVSVSTTLTGRDSYRDFFGVDLYEQMLQNLTHLLERMEVSSGDFSLHIGIKPTDESIETVISHPDYKRINQLHPAQDLEATIRSRSIFVDDWGGVVKLPAYLKKRPLIPRYRRPCRFLYETLHVHSNGKIAACACRDYNADSQLIVGDLRKDSLADVWHGETLATLRKDWRGENKVPEICKTCTFYQL